jgi:hypothetical protein
VGAKHRESYGSGKPASSLLKSLKEYSDISHKKLWQEVCTALIENGNGLAPEENKTEGYYLYFR